MTHSLTGLVNDGFIVLDDCFDVKFFQALQKESGLIDYQAANLTQGERITSIRGDSTRWIDEHCPIGMQYLQAINELAQFLIKPYTPAFAVVKPIMPATPAGFGYQWHSDNPQGRDERVLSAVFISMRVGRA